MLKIMRHLRYAGWVLAVVFFLLAMPGPSRADELEDAKILAQEAVSLWQAGRYTDAVAPAEKALALFEKNLGPDHPVVSTCLTNLAQILAATGKYDQSEALLKRALAIDEKAYGPDDPETATGQSNLAAHYFDLGQYDLAEPLFKQSLSILEKALPADDPKLATAFNNLGSLYEAQGQYALAEPFYRKSLAIREKVLGPDHPSTATVLNNLAGLCDAMGKYPEAEKIYRKVLTIREGTLGADHPLTADTLNDLGLLYSNMGRSEDALTRLDQALAIREKTLGSDHPAVAATLTNLGAVYEAAGNYPEAQKHYRRALDIRLKAFGPDHPDVAQSYNNLGFFFDAVGDWEQAEANYQKALATWEKTLPADHPDIAAVSNNLAEVYKAMGDFDRARPLYDRSLAIRLKIFGPDHPSTALGLNNLAGLLDDMNEFDQAENLYRKALAGATASLGPHNPMTADIMSNLAGVLTRDDRNAEALDLQQKALAIRLEALGENHPGVALSYNNLGALYIHQDEYSKALEAFTKSLAIEEANFGPNHPHVSHILTNMALARAFLKDYPSAHSDFLKALAVDDQLIDSVMGFTSEDRQLTFLALKKLGLMAYLSLATGYLADVPTVRIDAFNLWVRRKGIVLEAQRRYQEALANTENPKVQEMFFQLTKVRTQLSKLAFENPGQEGAAALRENMDHLEKQKDRYENQIAAQSRIFAHRMKQGQADARRLAQALPPASALVEFVHLDLYRYDDPHARPHWLPPHYLAFVLPGGPGDDVALIDLGPADTVDQAITDYKAAAQDITAPGYAKAREISQKLYGLVFAPLKGHLNGAQTIFLSPDGNLSLLPFEILADPDGRFLIEDFIFNYLPSARDLLTFGEPGLKSSDQVILVGDPDYNLDVPVAGAVTAASRSTAMGGMHFNPLPGTREEVLAIHELLTPSDIYMGDQARETVLTAARHPKIIHLATHGFFLGNADVSRLMGLSGPSRDLVFESDQTALEHFDNPLLRSGLALAGANQCLSTTDPSVSDGILTAEKVLGLRLQGTELVVLSACQTGLGEVKTGEGIYGLRRAFLQAGAQSLIMSMWPVPDRETKELMVAFYRNYQRADTNKVQAFRRAVLEVKDTVAERFGSPYPFYWGAFIFLGRP